jgi:hypothetical protein
MAAGAGVTATILLVALAGLPVTVHTQNDKGAQGDKIVRMQTLNVRDILRACQRERGGRGHDNLEAVSASRC